METSDYSSEKRLLRQKANRALKALNSAEKEAESLLVVDHLAKELSGMSVSGMVLIYAALPLEANVWEIIHRFPSLEFALPRVLPESRQLECRRFADSDIDLSKGAYQVMEPIPERCPLVSLDEIGVIVTPGLSFTKSGARLGKGGGYYDKLLSETQVTAHSIGVGFDCQLCQDIPMEKHDQYLDCVIMPSGILRP